MYIYLYILITTALIVEFFTPVCDFCSQCRTIATGCQLLIQLYLNSRFPHDFHLHKYLEYNSRQLFLSLKSRE